MANKQMANLSINNRYFKDQAACYKKAYEAMLAAVAGFAQDNPETDMLALGQISTDIAERLNYHLKKSEMLRTRY